jgi:hypothetical protein
VFAAATERKLGNVSHNVKKNDELNKTSSNIIHMKEVLLMQKILGFALAITGILLLMNEPIYFGLIFIFFAINTFSTEGFEMNLKNKTYRRINSIFGMHYGKWKSYPQIDYISVFKTKESKSSEGTSARISKDVINFNLYYSEIKYLTFYKTDYLEDAHKAIEKLKINLDIEILDKTLK